MCGKHKEWDGAHDAFIVFRLRVCFISLWTSLIWPTGRILPMWPQITEGAIVGSGGQLKLALQPEHDWKLNWDRTQPLRPMEASLVAEDTAQRWFTVTQMRTMAPGDNRTHRWGTGLCCSLTLSFSRSTAHSLHTFLVSSQCGVVY